MSKSLLAFDTDRIKNYVFATGKLKEIRGASAILDELNRVQMLEIVENAGGRKIYANGGSGLFVVDTAKIDGIISAVEKLYHEQTRTASITGVSVEQSDDFQTDFKMLSYRLRAAKDSKKGKSTLVTHPYLRFCDSCGTEYAEQAYTPERADGEDAVLLCISCINKRKKDKSIKETIHKFDTSNVGLWSTLIPLLAEQNYDITGRNRPKDFETVASMSHPNNYIGLIYADGDSMGKELEKLSSETELKKFSAIVDGSIYEAVAQSITKHLHFDGKVWPFDILLLGGDDLVMVTPADKALETALTVMEKFTELSREKLGYPLKLSVGVAIAHTNYPFGQLLRLAESTLKFAKKEGAKRRQSKKEWEGGLLNFVVVSSANHLEFGEYYREDLTAKAEKNSNTNNLFRTLRPYDATSFKLLLAMARRKPIIKAPRSKMKQLRQSIFKSQKQAMIDGLTMLFHWRSDKQREAIQEVVEKFARLNQNGHLHGLLFPWYQTGSKSEPEYYTPLLDLIEISDFISVSDRENAND